MSMSFTCRSHHAHCVISRGSHLVSGAWFRPIVLQLNWVLPNWINRSMISTMISWIKFPMWEPWPTITPQKRRCERTFIRLLFSFICHRANSRSNHALFSSLWLLFCLSHNTQSPHTSTYPSVCGAASTQMNWYGQRRIAERRKQTRTHFVIRVSLSLTLALFRIWHRQHCTTPKI